MARQGVSVIRYVDDIVVLTKSARAAQRLLETTQWYRGVKRKLRIHFKTAQTINIQVKFAYL